MTAQQELIARFIASSHLKQRVDSDYFSVNGGVSIEKVAQNINLAVNIVLADATILQNQGDLELTDRNPGVGLRATTQLFVTLAAIDQANLDAQDAQVIPNVREQAISGINLRSPEGAQWRALALILIDELNNLRQWDAAFKAQVALAANLADLKTRVAALPAMPDRTFLQFKNAFINKINNGLADT